MKLQPFQLHYLANRIEQAHTLQSWVGEFDISLQSWVGKFDIRKQVASGSLPRIDHSRIERLEKLETIDATPYMKKLATITVFVRDQIKDGWATPAALRKINTFVEEFYRLIDIAWENRERPRAEDNRPIRRSQWNHI